MYDLSSFFWSQKDFKTGGLIIVKIYQGVVNIWILPPVCCKYHAEKSLG